MVPPMYQVREPVQLQVGEPAQSQPQLREPVQPQPLTIQVQTRRSWALAAGSFVLGVILAVASLIVFAPHPSASRPDSAPSEMVVSLDDAFLSQVVAKGLAADRLPFILTNVQAHAALNDQISISAAADLGLASASLQASGQISVSNGHLVVHTSKAMVGGLAMPNAVTSLMDAQIDQQLAHATQGLLAHGAQYQLTGVTTTDGALELLLMPA